MQFDRSLPLLEGANKWRSAATKFTLAYRSPRQVLLVCRNLTSSPERHDDRSCGSSASINAPRFGGHVHSRAGALRTVIVEVHSRENLRSGQILIVEDHPIIARCARLLAVNRNFTDFVKPETPAGRPSCYVRPRDAVVLEIPYREKAAGVFEGVRCLPQYRPRLTFTREQYTGACSRPRSG